MGLLQDPDRLLTAILFWNLLVNLTYFALARSLQPPDAAAARRPEAGTFAVASVLVLIVFGEMIPGHGRHLGNGVGSPLIAVPLAGMVRLLDPVIPVFRWTTILRSACCGPNSSRTLFAYHRSGTGGGISTADATLLSPNTVLKGSSPSRESASTN